MKYSYQELETKVKEKYKKQSPEKHEWRFMHVKSVEEMVVTLIERFSLKVDIEKAKTAALLHDFAKFDSKERFIQLQKKYNLASGLLKEPFSIQHALFGPAILVDELGFVDEEIFDAIRYHPIGRSHMTPLEEVLFLADFIDSTRTYQACLKAREVAINSFRGAIAMKLEHLIHTQESPHPSTVEAYNYYKIYTKEKLDWNY